MKVLIIRPEEIIYEGQADTVIVPGAAGFFQILEQHAPILSVLTAGSVQLHFHRKEHIEFNKRGGKLIPHPNDDKILTFEVHGGLVEMNQNLVTIFVD
ncbi:MAG: F0F1 ATP synthase subunit epsilon [Flavobacteriales bacterium AspAUS03]